MGISSNIMRRKGSSCYYLRIFVPKELQATFGKQEITKSLRTPNPKEAKRLARPLQMEWDQKFSSMVQQAKRPLDEYELQHAIWDRYNALLKADEARRASRPTKEDLDAIWAAVVQEFDGPDIATWRILEGIAGEPGTEAQERSKRLAALVADIKSNSIKTIYPIVAQVAESRMLAILPHSDAERQLAHSLQRADIEALKVIVKRDDGDFSGTPTDPLVKPPTISAPLIAAPGENIMELFEVYASENPNTATEGTLSQSRKVVHLFAQFLGKHFPARSISKKQVREWKAALKEFPVKATESNDFKGMDFNKIIAANKSIGKRAIASKTLNRYLASLGAFCKWLVAQGYLEHSPTQGMLLTLDKTVKKIFPYTIQQLNEIFQSPLFTGSQSLRMAHKPGNVLIRDHHYWLPLIALFTGARLNELCQLLSDEVREIKGHWVFDITDENDVEQKLKTVDSKRIVPVHPKLVELGLMEYVVEQKKNEDKWLFPKIVLDTRRSRSGHYSGFYRKYIERIGVK